MESNLNLYLFDRLSQETKKFEPIAFPHVGMYACGPTSYWDLSIKKLRYYIVLDVLKRHLNSSGCKVRYVRGITDIGYLEGDPLIDESKSFLEKLEPMEIVRHYTDRFHACLNLFNLIRPDIEPTATGHITEDINQISSILDNGYAYVSEGTVYFDTEKARKDGMISDDEMLRLVDQGSKYHIGKNPSDFRLWHKSAPDHIMKWSSPWSLGSPNWHIECSAFTNKYLGPTYDIHAGDEELMGHHECIRIQNAAIDDTSRVSHWFVVAPTTLDGIPKSNGKQNRITVFDIVQGADQLGWKSFDPMVIKLCVLKEHYRTNITISEMTLLEAEDDLSMLTHCVHSLERFLLKNTKQISLSPDTGPNESILETNLNSSAIAINDDLDTSKLINNLLLISRRIAYLHDNDRLTNQIAIDVKAHFEHYLTKILGIHIEVLADTEKGFHAFFKLPESIKSGVGDYIMLFDEYLKNNGILCKIDVSKEPSGLDVKIKPVKLADLGLITSYWEEYTKLLNSDANWQTQTTNGRKNKLAEKLQNRIKNLKAELWIARRQLKMNIDQGEMMRNLLLVLSNGNQPINLNQNVTLVNSVTSNVVVSVEREKVKQDLKNLFSELSEAGVVEEGDETEFEKAIRVVDSVSEGTLTEAEAKATLAARLAPLIKKVTDKIGEAHTVFVRAPDVIKVIKPYLTSLYNYLESTGMKDVLGFLKHLMHL